MKSAVKVSTSEPVEVLRRIAFSSCRTSAWNQRNSPANPSTMARSVEPWEKLISLAARPWMPAIVLATIVENDWVGKLAIETSSRDRERDTDAGHGIEVLNADEADAARLLRYAQLSRRTRGHRCL